jgi:hypothetical protein|uniref:Uncharacterized protein n=1 Tax=viral metagenome TaxID=1070528 RepID=A0A6C0J9I5_9ZZZZ
MSNLNDAYKPLVKSNQDKLNIPVDVNSKIPLELRWHDENTKAPDPVPNGGLFGGPQAIGPYASIYVTPTATNLINNNLRSANPPPGATEQYIGTNRMGNNYIPMPGVYWYNDTHPVNKGPFAMKVVQNK